MRKRILTKTGFTPLENPSINSRDDINPVRPLVSYGAYRKGRVKARSFLTGFTLVETAVVVAVLGLVAAITIPAIERSQERVGVVREAVDLRNLQGALEQYHNTWGKYPQGSNAELVIHLSPYVLFDEKYIKDGLFIDPWGNPYVYRCPGILHPESYDLFSWGPEGPPQGELVYGFGGAGFRTVVCGEPHSGVFGGIHETGSVSPVGRGDIEVTPPPSPPQGGSPSSGTGGTSSGGTTTSGSTGGGSSITINTQVPWDLVAIPNDGMVYLSWRAPTLETPPDYFRIYRSWFSDYGYELIATVPYLPYPDRQGFFPDKTAVNGYTYYYCVTAVWEGKEEGEASKWVKASSSETTVYAQKISSGLEYLENSSTGRDIANILESKNVTIGFGQISSGAGAWFEPANETVIINYFYFSENSKITAALLAHEGTHAQWHFDSTQGTPIPGDGERSPNSIDQEYQAFLNGASVWNEIKGNTENFSQDVWTAIISLGEEEAKAFIRAVYWGLPEY